MSTWTGGRLQEVWLRDGKLGIQTWGAAVGL